MDWTLAFLIVVMSALIQACTGFGFAILAIPLLMLLYPTHYAISLCNFLSLISCLAMMPRVHRDIEKPVLKRLFLGALAGLPLGALLYYFAAVMWLKLIVSLAIIAAAVTMMYRVTFSLGKGKRVGAVSGFLTSSIGMPGPPVVLYLVSRNTDKSSFRGTSLAYYCLVYPLSLTLQYLSGRFEAHFLSAFLLVPAIFLGQAVGIILHRHINQAWFRRVTFALLLITAVSSLMRGFSG